MDRYYPAREFLIACGCATHHHSGRSFFGHLMGVYIALIAHGYDDDICYAGLFHSIYGTEHFPVVSLSPTRRAEVRALIGERAEALAYLNCAMDNAAFDTAIASGVRPASLPDRFEGGKAIPITEQQWLELRIVHWYDWFEKAQAGWMYKHRHQEHAGVARSLGPEFVSRHKDALGRVRYPNKHSASELVASSMTALAGS